MKVIKLSQVPKWQGRQPSAAEFLSGLRSQTYRKEFMASLVNNYAKGKLWDGTIDLNTDDIRAVLCMTNTTADTEDDLQATGSFTTLDRCDATGYADVALTGEAVNIDTGNNRAEFDANDVSYPGLSGDATRGAQGVLIHEFITDDAGSLPILFVDFTVDLSAAATQYDIPWDAEGVLQVS